jgi:hypothetical protein
MPGFITHNSNITYVRFLHCSVHKLEVFICCTDVICVIAAEECNGEPFTRQDAETEDEVSL